MNGKEQSYFLYRRKDKQILNNYWSAAPLPICGKIFECLICNSLFEYFIQNDLIYPKQCGFKPGDSCANRLVSIKHEIYQSFADVFKIRCPFLDISNAFDKVWHNGVIYKVKQYAIADNFLDTLTNLLSERKQRVILNGEHSTKAIAEAGVPHGSVLGRLFFIIYIKCIAENLVSNPKCLLMIHHLFW